jgi:acyl-CoA thioesterase
MPEPSTEGRDQVLSATDQAVGAVRQSNSAAGIEDSSQRRADRFGIDGVSGFMGMRWDSPDTVRLEIRPELINAGGLLSGVVTYALVDYCMGSTLWPHTTDDEQIATLNISINYIQTATEGEIVCKTKLDRRNRTNAVLRSEVRHEDDRLLVSAIGSYAIFPRRRPRVP